MLISAK